MRLVGTIAGLCIATMAAGPLAAQVNYRQGNQERRIQQGVRSGEINRREYHRLQDQQARIDRTEDRMRYRNGGGLTHAQRARLDARQSRASANIRRQKHDGQERRW